MKSSGIGGQAVMEGVMMKNKDRYAVAVRKPDNDIEIQVSEYKALAERYKVLGIPIVRGVVAFVESLVIGMKTLTYSASFFDEEPKEDDKKETSSTKNQNKSGKKQSKGKNGKSKSQQSEEKAKPKESSAKETSSKEKATMVATVMLSIVLAIGIFMMIPYFLSRALSTAIASDALLALIEGVIRVVLFLGYVVAISQMNDIKRVFMYHGAEHKSINCIEDGCELTVENVREHSRYHKRCGTSFLLVVMCVSILLFIFIRTDIAWLRVVLRLVLVPVIAGISYEFIRLAGKSDNAVVTALSKPGLWLQRLTTKEPDDSMIEVAIKSVEAVYDWHPYVEEIKALKEKEAEKAAMKDEEPEMNADLADATEESEALDDAVEVKVEKTEKSRRKLEKLTDELDILDVEFKGKKKHVADIVDEAAEGIETSSEEFRAELEEQTDSDVENAVKAKERYTGTEFGLAPADDDEDDEILKKLDKFFDSKKKK